MDTEDKTMATVKRIRLECIRRIPTVSFPDFESADITTWFDAQADCMVMHLRASVLGEELQT